MNLHWLHFICSLSPFLSLLTFHCSFFCRSPLMFSEKRLYLKFFQFKPFLHCSSSPQPTQPTFLILEQLCFTISLKQYHFYSGRQSSRWTLRKPFLSTSYHFLWWEFIKERLKEKTLSTKTKVRFKKERKYDFGEKKERK